jgi:hypothetical protein
MTVWDPDPVPDSYPSAQKRYLKILEGRKEKRLAPRGIVHIPGLEDMEAGLRFLSFSSVIPNCYRFLFVTFALIYPVTYRWPSSLLFTFSRAQKGPLHILYLICT